MRLALLLAAVLSLQVEAQQRFVKPPQTPSGFGLSYCDHLGHGRALAVMRGSLYEPAARPLTKTLCVFPNVMCTKWWGLPKGSQPQVEE